MVYKISEMREINLPVSRIRSVSAQLIASMAPNLLLLDLGMAISFVTIALPDLLNASEGLSLNEEQASWFGSLPFLSQPFGALASGPIVDYFGRKRATFLVNIPHVIAWILMYFSWNLPSLFIANALLGLGTGIMEAPISSYVSEICEPSVRGAICTVTQLFLSIGMSAMYMLGAATSWRMAALLSLSVPIVTMLMALFVVPDTPVWLLSRGKEQDALKSLCYLRGWTSPDNVREEFDELVVYAKTIDSCVICNKENTENKHEKVENECEHDKINIIKRFFMKFNIIMLCKETLRPLFFSLMYFMFYVMSGLYPIKPNMENVCGAMGMADNGKTIVVMVGVLSFLASVIVIIGIKYLGKRKLGIPAMFGTAICCTGLSVYASLHLSDKVFSYDPKTFPEEKSVVPLVLFYGLTIFTGINVSWILLGEVFPFRSRATSQGIAAAWNYIVTFVGAKTLIDLETNFKLTGVFATYAAFGYIGTLYLYLYMPETEGKTLPEVESFYHGKHRIFADDWFVNMFRKSKREKN
ncbi:facilitated trehalose transporter Tret1-like [Anticarsia gemmatalis]|uniref:facilitated trehalose transporter Tret1-like n=1 Tax=Anticarsia gemmatalis TaxID=129554 RepID=UPI003F76BE0C